MQTSGTSRAEIPRDCIAASRGWRALVAPATLGLLLLIIGMQPMLAQEGALRRIPEPSFYRDRADDPSPADPDLSASVPPVMIEAPAEYFPTVADAIYLAPPDYFVRSVRAVGWEEPTSIQSTAPLMRGWSPPAIPPGLGPQYLPSDVSSDGPTIGRPPMPDAPLTADIEANWSPGMSHHGPAYPADCEDFCFRVLPDGVIWKAYLAGAKESRLAAHIVHVDGDSTFFDGNLGGRFALWRYGNGNAFHPEGIEFDVEGAAQVRLDIPHDVDVRAVDFRAGGFFTWGDRWRQTKVGYYHLSSHLGDEFLIKNPGYPRLNFARDVIIVAHSIYLTEELRIYGEAGWAFWNDVTSPWEFQFGVDYSPAGPTGPMGAPFFALNGHLRQELDFGGNFVAQAGWAWKGDESGNMFRAGLHYFNGASSQFSFYQRFEQQIGFGIWYDR